MPAHAHGPLAGQAPPALPDPAQVWEVDAKNKAGVNLKLKYSQLRVIGQGSFGVVSSAKATGLGGAGDEGQQVAIKRMVQDPRYANRELDIQKVTSHPNIAELLAFYYEEVAGTVNLYLILEYLPTTLDRQSSYYNRSRSRMPLLEQKLYAYQLFRGLASLHAGGVCHRDIKPHNVIVDPTTGVLKIIDFGSAKQLVEGQDNVSYICSRWYRAPELLFGATNYTTQIDLWAAATVVAEVAYGQPLFRGDSSIDTLVDIIKTLGTPTRAEVMTLNPRYENHAFPSIRRQPLERVFRPRTDALLLDLLTKLLVYTPTQRLDAWGAIAHPFFDELREEGTLLASGGDLPPLFNFTKEELSSVPEDLRAKVVPEWVKPGLKERGIDLEDFIPIPAHLLRYVFN